MPIDFFGQFTTCFGQFLACFGQFLTFLSFPSPPVLRFSISLQGSHVSVFSYPSVTFSVYLIFFQNIFCFTLLFWPENIFSCFFHFTVLNY